MQSGWRKLDPVSMVAAGRSSASATSARAGRGASPVRLSATGLSVGERGYNPQPQEAAAGVPRREPKGMPPRWPQAPSAPGHQRCYRIDRTSAGRSTSCPIPSPAAGGCSSVRGRRLHPGMPGAGGGHVAIGCAGHAGAHAADRHAGQAA